MDTRIVLAALVGGACAAAGAGVVTVLRAESVPTPGQRENVATPAPMPVAAGGLERVELDALVAELRSLREELASRRVAVTGAESAPPPTTLHGELRELRALLERRATLAPSVELDLSSKGPRRAELFARSNEAEPEIDDDERLSKRYQLWSPQRVLDEFGAPDHVDTDDGAMRWTYSENDDAIATCFDFADGYVVNVWVGDD